MLLSVTQGVFVTIWLFFKGGTVNESGEIVLVFLKNHLTLNFCEGILCHIIDDGSIRTLSLLVEMSD